MAEKRGEVVEGSYDVVVVGGGIMGSCIAYQLGKRGKSVMLLEQYDFLHHRGSSHGESRTIRVTYPELYYTEMMREGYKLWEEAEEEAGYVVFRRTGQLDFGAKQDAALQAVICTLVEAGIEHKLLLPHQLAVDFPQFSIPHDWLAVYTAHGGVVRASKAVAMFQALALKNGAVLRDNAKVTKVVDGTEGVHVHTSRGTATARICVVAAGAWSKKIVKELSGLELPVQPLHTTIAYWEVEERCAGKFSVEEGFPVFACYQDPEMYGTPSLEYPGLIKASLHGGRACDPDHRSLLPDLPSSQQLLSPFLAALFQGQVKSKSPALAEACMYSVTPDEDFILDFLPHSSTILIAAGFSGHGFKFGPLVGRVMADLATLGSAQGIPLPLFSISRFLSSPSGNSKPFTKQVHTTPTGAL